MNFGIVLAELMDYINSKNSHGKRELQDKAIELLIDEAKRVKEGK